MINYAKQIKQLAERRNIEFLVHFTHINNVASILEHGIMPRLETEWLNQSLEEREFVFPDDVRADGKNASCLSIMFPNNEMLWHKRQKYPDEHWVFLLLKPDVLWECDCAFYPTNAASTGVRQQPVENFKTATAFEAMFADLVVKETRNGRQEIPRIELKSYLPTDVQAEILVFNTIAPSYITACYFHWNLGDIDSLNACNYPNLALFPNAEWVKNKTKHLFYNFREQVNWR